MRGALRHLGFATGRATIESLGAAGAPRGILSLAPSRPRASVLLPDAADMSHVEAQLRAAGVADASVSVVDPSLEDVFLDVAERTA